MLHITQKTREACVHEWTQDKQQEYFSYLEKNFLGELAASQLTNLFTLALCSYKPEVTWLDEASEALCNCATGYNSYLLARQNTLPSVQSQLDQNDSFYNGVLESQRKTIYAIGAICYHLVQLNKEEASERKNLSRLNILQGGIEPKFIPSLSSETKRQIEGSFKITNDTELQQLALTDESEISYDKSDKLLRCIIDVDSQD